MAGAAGYELEKRVGPQAAGRMIYLASAGTSPHFFATNEQALKQLRERAEDAASVQP